MAWSISNKHHEKQWSQQEGSEWPPRQHEPGCTGDNYEMAGFISSVFFLLGGHRGNNGNKLMERDNNRKGGKCLGQRKRFYNFQGLLKVDYSINSRWHINILMRLHITTHKFTKTIIDRLLGYTNNWFIRDYIESNTLLDKCITGKGCVLTYYCSGCWDIYHSLRTL